MQNKFYRIIKEYNRFYLANNGYYNECFFKDEYKPHKNIITKKYSYERVLNNIENNVIIK